MLSKELVDEVKSSLANGSDPIAIKNDLRTRGFANDEIDSAFVEAQSANDPEESGTTGWRMPRKEVFIAILAAIALGIAGVAAAYFTGK